MATSKSLLPRSTASSFTNDDDKKCEIHTLEMREKIMRFSIVRSSYLVFLGVAMAV